MVASSTKDPPTQDPADPGRAGPAGPADPSLRERLGGTGVLVTLGVAVVGALLLLVALVAPRWFTGGSSAAPPGRTESVRPAEDWVAANKGFDDHVVVDAADGDDPLRGGISDEGGGAVRAP